MMVVLQPLLGLFMLCMPAVVVADDAAKNAENLRTRLQNHVAAQVNKLLSDKNLQGATGTMGGGGGSGTTQKLELKIDLPPDLASLVNQGGALKFHRKENGELGDLKESIINVVSGGSVHVVSDGGEDGVESSADADAGADAEPCPLGTYNADTGSDPCRLCPEGQTTVRRGSMACEVVTEEDMLSMFYDVMHGDTWPERQRRGWKSKKSACDWEGISCNDAGEINGLSFPIGPMFDRPEGVGDAPIQ